MKRRVIASLLTLVLCLTLLPAPAFAADTGEDTPEPAATDIYVSSNAGNDSNAGTTQDTAVATLAKAVEIAPDGATIYVMSDLTMTKCARYYDKDLTITSLDPNNPVTISRGTEFDPLSDDARSWYNPAMIEVQGNQEGAECGLTLKNIILDDTGEYEGTVFAQAISGKSEENKDNLVYVQDAMIASNATVPCTITLGEGAVLRNFGGMSAVRVTDQAKLVMKSGSVIEDASSITRSKGDAGSVGPAGAVWLQGSDFEMKSGAEIKNVNGRAIYADGGTVTMDGMISDIQSNTHMWNACQGIALHLRGGASATFSGTIQNVKSTDNDSYVVYDVSSSIAFKSGSTIKNCFGTAKYGSLIYSTGLTKEALLDGTITECHVPNNLIYSANSNFPTSIGPNAQITNNSGSRLFYDNSVLDLQNAPAMTISGTITNNTLTDSMFVGSNNGREITICDGAKINQNTLTSSTGSAIFWAGANRRIVMENGSEVCGNTVAKGAVAVVAGEGNCFTMKGGTISGNTVEDGSLMLFTSGSWNQCSTMAIEGGTISGNTVPHVLTVASGIGQEKVPGINSYLLVTENSPKDVYFMVEGKTVTVDSGTKLGNADWKQSKYAFTDSKAGGSRCVTLLNAAAVNYGCKSAFSTFWAQNADGTLVAVKMDDLAEGEEAKFDKTKSVYVLIQETNEKGAPADGAEVKLLPATVAEDGAINFTLPGNTNGYAVALVQADPDAELGTLTLSTTVTELTEGKEPYSVPYTATFIPKEGLASGVTPQTVEFIAPPITGDSVSISNNRAEWTGTLASELFEGGKAIDAVAVLTVTYNNESRKILSNIVSTKMTGLLTVTFGANGGAFADGSTTSEVKTESGSSVTLPANPTRSGYTFTGWNTQQDGKGSSFDNRTVITGSMTVYAQWSENSSGSGGDGSKTYYYFAIEKVDAQDGSVLSSAKFGLFLDGKQIATAASNRSGIAMFRVNASDYRKINAKSDLYYQELTAPEGYVVNSDEVSIEKSNLTTSWSKAEKDAETVRNYRGSTPDLLNGDDHFAYVVGYQDGCVHPNALITRAETATIFFRLLKDDVRDDNLRTSNTFADVPNDYWANTAISTMAGLGIVQGRSSTAFDPNASITRAEFAAICARFDTGKSSGTQTFSDIKGHWAQSYIERAAELGWIKGFEDGTFRPNDCITRAQAMTMINRVLNRIPEDASDLLPDMNVWPDCNPGDWFYLAVQEATNSHNYKHKAGNYETWISMKQDPDWTRYEN